MQSMPFEKKADPVLHPYAPSFGPLGGDFTAMENMPTSELDVSNPELAGMEDYISEMPVDETPGPTPELVEKPDYRAKDKVLYDQWAQNKTSSNMSALMKHLSPLIYSEVQRQSGALPKAALAAEAKIWTMKAIKTFDPSKGFALSTHVMNYLPKVRRLNYKHQNAARLPENQQRQYREYSKAKANLENDLGRDPTDEELAKHLGWSKGYTVKFKGRLFSDLIESGSENASQMSQYSDSNMLFQEIMNRLTPQERMIAELKGTIPAPELAKKLGFDINRLNYEQRKLWAKIKKLQEEVGYE